MSDKEEAINNLQEIRAALPAAEDGRVLNRLLRECVEIKNDCDRQALSFNVDERQDLDDLIRAIKAKWEKI